MIVDSYYGNANQEAAPGQNAIESYPAAYLGIHDRWVHIISAPTRNRRRDLGLSDVHDIWAYSISATETGAGI